MVDWWYWALLASMMTGGLIVRLARGRPLVDWVKLGAAEAVIGGIATAALAVHCIAMFLPALVPGIGPLPSAAQAIRDLGAVSQIAFWVPAVVVLVVLRQLPWPALAILAVALFAVGVTMFWPFPLAVHLTAIAIAVGILAGIATQTVTPLFGGAPRSRGPLPVN